MAPAELKGADETASLKDKRKKSKGHNFYTASFLTQSIDKVVKGKKKLRHNFHTANVIGCMKINNNK